MTDAPEKMWVFPKKDWFDAGASTHKITVAGAKDVEYYHGDTVKARIAELGDMVHKRGNDIAVLKSDLEKAQARIVELEAALAAKTLAELPAHMGMNDYDAQARISELEAMVADMTAHIRIDPDE